MKNGRLQCKDIPNEAFLEAVRQVCEIRKMNWAMRWEVGAVLAGHPELVRPSAGFPYGIIVQVDWEELFPQKLVIAKARKLMRRGLLEGCDCGCRGDFELTDLTVINNVIYKRDKV
jgi:hypothetical protein